MAKSAHTQQSAQQFQSTVHYIRGQILELQETGKELLLLAQYSEAALKSTQ